MSRRLSGMLHIGPLSRQFSCNEQSWGEVVLKSLLGLEIDVENLPWGPETAVPAGIETIIMAEEVRPKRGRKVEVIEVKREGGGTRKVVVDEVVVNDDNEIVHIKEEPID
ncbi:hypothetical protein MRB53_037010 [Persea americana]|nr:hypothetical protein MRB53_037010 [Persea americana]